MADDVTTIRALVIHDAETLRLAGELAALRHMSVPDAVADAVRTRLERERELQAGTEALLALGREIREHLIEPLAMSDVDEMLYGPDGLPA